MITIVVAPDKFKGSLTAQESADAIERGIRQVLPKARVLKVPMADGGEGTVRALVQATGGRILRQRVMGPLGKPVTAEFGILGDGKTAVIEMAEASGYELVPADKRNPMVTTTYGTGELILTALKRGCRRLIVGIGGSATNDGGSGMAQALGVRLLDARGKELRRGIGGGQLKDVARIDLSKSQIAKFKFEMTVASDVRNPLIGPRGASAVFGPQKGATPAMVKQLDINLRRWAQLLERDVIACCGEQGSACACCGARGGIPIAEFPGGGAAGGLGAGLRAFFGAQFRAGVEIVTEHAQLAKKIRGADLVITGEGRLDHSTLDGKTPFGVAQLAKTMGVPVIAIGGSVALEAEKAFERAGVAATLSLMNGPMSLEQALKQAGPLLSAAAARAIRLIEVGTCL